MPAQWQLRRGFNNPHRRINAASRIFSIWLYQDQMRNFEDRRIACALMAIAQHIARKGAMPTPARLLVTKSDDAEFMYPYVAHITPNASAIFENSTCHSDAVVPLTITRTKIPYNPHSTFCDRLMLELQKPLLDKHP
ncbi:hypothetical protein NOR_03924 [Metarhizium rileyi]|uniref:Uncharacterized protein n=1 Tax=Metarhizium rileyi (strain RCEF 4871) TaxID=1649241 RepID=A0A167ENC8_METRR|nr:hypothetical protein NOR_03924 [Metarhizium rileyi RCEF 4871]